MRLGKIAMLAALCGGVAYVINQSQAQKRAPAGPRPRAAARSRDGDLDSRLTGAIEDTFPASDPYTVGQLTSQSAERPIDRRPAAIDPRSVERQAAALERKLEAQRRNGVHNGGSGEHH